MKLFSPDAVLAQCKIFLSGWVLLSLLLFSIHLFPTAKQEQTAQAPLSAPSVSDTVSPSQQSEVISEPTVLPTQNQDSPQPEKMTSATDTSDTPILVYYNQKDAVWEDDLYGKDSISGYGCGPTVCAMMISSLTAYTVTPADMAEWSVQNGCYIQGGGSYHTLIPLACKSYGLSVTGYTKNDRDKIIAALQQGAYVCVIMGPGDFTETGHFILLTGITADGRITVADPASRQNSQKLWDPDLIFEQARSYAASGGPFWAVQSRQTIRG